MDMIHPTGSTSVVVSLLSMVDNIPQKEAGLQGIDRGVRVGKVPEIDTHTNTHTHTHTVSDTRTTRDKSRSVFALLQGVYWRGATREWFPDWWISHIISLFSFFFSLSFSSSLSVGFSMHAPYCVNELLELPRKFGQDASFFFLRSQRGCI